MPKQPKWSEQELQTLRDWAKDPKNRRWKGCPIDRSYFGITQKAKELNIQLIGPQSKTKYDKRLKVPAVKTYWIKPGLAGCEFDMEPVTKRQHWSPKYDDNYAPTSHHLCSSFRLFS